MKVKFYFLLLFTILLIAQAKAQQTVKITPSGIGYLEYLPKDYQNSSDKFPLVIALHGVKERGPCSDNHFVVKSAVPEVANAGLPKYVKYGTQYPFILVSPQLKKCYPNWPADYVMEVLNHVKKYLRVDEDRIYLTGLSLGGGGTWTTLQAHPNVFAAVVAMCGNRNDPSQACDIASENVPVWAFHGDKDNIVSYHVTTRMVNAINTCTPRCTPQAKVTIYPGVGHVVWDKAYKETNVLNWMLSHKKGNSTQDPNEPPIADAGSDITKVLPVDTIEIKGVGSDVDGSIVSYSWKQKDGPSGVTLLNPDSAYLKLTNIKVGVYTFELTVTDEDGARGTDEVNVTVESSSENSPPVVSAGSDKTIQWPWYNVKLKGNASDPDGSIASYRWTKKSGGNVTLHGETTQDLTVSDLSAGVYVFEFTATDNEGATASDEVQLTVQPKSNNNQSPIANAGPDRMVKLPNRATFIAGSGRDPDGIIISYVWSKISGKNCTMDGNKAILRISDLQPGSYIFRLTVKDNKGTTSSDDVAVVVDTPPVVNAGNDRTVMLPMSTLVLHGNALAANGTIVEYAWSKSSGPTVTMSNTKTPNLTLRNMKPGVYTFKLAVRNNLGFWASDQVKVLVKTPVTAQVTFPSRKSVNDDNPQSFVRSTK